MVLNKFWREICTLGESYGCNSSKQMWTDKGCGGTFYLNGTGLICDAEDAGYTICETYLSHSQGKSFAFSEVKKILALVLENNSFS